MYHIAFSNYGETTDMFLVTSKGTSSSTKLIANTSYNMTTIEKAVWISITEAINYDTDEFDFRLKQECESSDPDQEELNKFYKEPTLGGRLKALYQSSINYDNQPIVRAAYIMNILHRILDYKIYEKFLDTLIAIYKTICIKYYIVDYEDITVPLFIFPLGYCLIPAKNYLLSRVFQPGGINPYTFKKFIINYKELIKNNK